MPAILSDLKEHPLADSLEDTYNSDNQTEELLSKLSKVRFDSQNPPPEEEVLYWINETEIAHPGNLISVSAAVKSGKSAFCGAMIAAAISEGNQGDYLGIKAKNPDRKAVVHLDTEQSRSDHHAQIEKALARFNGKQPGYLYSYCLTGWSPSEALSALESVLENAKRETGGIHSVILDGVGDLIHGVNDEETSFALVGLLHSLALEYECVIVCVLHHNPGSEKSRGHLGSHLERKAETVLTLSKERGTEIVTAYSEKARRAPILKDEGPRFRWDGMKQMHVSLPSAGEAKAKREEEEAIELVSMVWKDDPGKTFPYNQLIEKIAKVTGKGTTTAKKRQKMLVDQNLIQSTLLKGQYTLTSSGQGIFAK